MSDISETDLMRLADGELPTHERLALEGIIESNPAAKQKLARLRRQNELIRLSFQEHQDELALARLKTNIRQQFKQHDRRAAGSNRAFGTALAASVAISVIAAVFAYMFGVQHADNKVDQLLAMQAMERSLRQETIETALETTTGGESLTWSSPTSGTHGIITPLNTFRSAGGRFCRELTVTTKSAMSEEIAQGVACRHQSGGWTVLTSQT